MYRFNIFWSVFIGIAGVFNAIVKIIIVIAIFVFIFVFLIIVAITAIVGVIVVFFNLSLSQLLS